MNAPFVAADHVCCYCLFRSVISGSTADAPGTFPSLRSVSRFWHAHRPCCSAAGPSHSGCCILIWVVAQIWSQFQRRRSIVPLIHRADVLFLPTQAPFEVLLHGVWWTTQLKCVFTCGHRCWQRVAGPTMRWRSVGTAMSKGNTLLQYKGLWCSCRPPPTENVFSFSYCFGLAIQSRYCRKRGRK